MSETLHERAVKHYFEAEKDAREDKVLLHIPTVMREFAEVELDRATRTATRREAELVSALEHYGNADNWICGNENCDVDSGACGHVMDIYAGQSGDGSIVAVRALAAYIESGQDEQGEIK